ncbi:toll-like receptor 4 [Mytilus edulis]|uniref:toll-like receptor 4 n=1 Tax=Mytilus edulis TaxID=6550 RepID=UPI0039F0C3F4
MLKYIIWMCKLYQFVPIFCISLSVVCAKECSIVVLEDSNEFIKIADCSRRGLSQVPQTLPRDITVLNLRRNNFQIISNFSFKRYRFLQKVTLSENKLQKIEDQAFFGLSRLNNLNMSDNTLDLLTVYTPEMFLPIENLTVLDIQRNIQEHNNDVYRYPDVAFGVFKKIVYLALDLAPIPELGQGFQNLQNLKSLIFDRCFLKFLRGDTFENFTSNLEELRLTRCLHYFLHVDDNALSPFPKIAKINFEGSCMHLKQALSMLSSYSGKTLDIINLRGLNCPRFNSDEYPFVLTVTKDMMRYLKTVCVETLDLSDNGIVDFEENSLLSFDRPECIKHLYFKGNRFAFTKGRQIDELNTFFNKSIALKTFDYSFIPVRYWLEENAVHHNEQNYHSSNNIIYLPRSLEKLILSNLLCNDIRRHFMNRRGSNLTYLDVSYSYSNNVVIFESNASFTTETLVLDGHFHAALYQIEIVNFIHVKTLLWRSANLLYAMYPLDNMFYKKFITWFRKLKKLEHLDMSSNLLWILPDDLFLELDRLSELRLSKNLFQSVPTQIIFCSTIKTLDLRNNLLSTVDYATRVWADLMSTNHGFSLYIEGNAFECKCDNLNFIKWIQETKVDLDSRSYKCTLLNGTVITVLEAYETMHDLFSNCRNSIWLTVSSTLLGTSIIGVVLLIIYSKRWNIAVFFYRKFRKMVEKKYGKSYTYDVFVSYGGDCIPWITQCLIPKLETEWKLKICLKDRDFLPGESYFDIEAESIESSRHVIFLLTPKFKNSHECLFEIERVKHEKRMKNIENIIVISKDMTLKDVPVELANIWNYVIFIQWPAGDCDDLDVTWQKLKKWISSD